MGKLGFEPADESAAMNKIVRVVLLGILFLPELCADRA